jgi:hypothetical protein
MTTTSPARRGLDELLKQHPFYDVLEVDWQIDVDEGGRRWAGPWILVNLGQPSEAVETTPAWAVHRFAIWRSTGAVYPIGHDGAVTDDPLIEAPA